MFSKSFVKYAVKFKNRKKNIFYTFQIQFRSQIIRNGKKQKPEKLHFVNFTTSCKD